MPDSQEHEKPKELPSEFPKISLDTVYKVGDLFLGEEGKFDEFNRMMDKAQDSITKEEPDLYALLWEGMEQAAPQKASEFISGVLFVRSAFDEEGIKLPAVTMEATMAFAEEALRRDKVRRITDAEARKKLKDTESTSIAQPIDRAEENPSLMSFISALGIEESGTFTPFGSGAMFYYEVKRRQFMADQIRKSPFGSDIKSEGGDQEQITIPQLPERKTFEVEGDIWDYDELAEVMEKVGKSFLERFYPTTYSEEEKSRLLGDFVKAIKKEHPIEFLGELELPGSIYEGYPIVLSFHESYDSIEMPGPFDYDDENRLILATDDPPSLAKNTGVTNHCDITISAKPKVFAHLKDRFPTKAQEFKEDMVKWAEEITANIPGLQPEPSFKGPTLPTYEQKAKEKPYDVRGFTMIRFDDEQFKKGRGKVKIVADMFVPEESSENPTP